MKTCNHCQENYSQKEVERIYGEDSRPALLGFCSAQCHTQAFTTQSPVEHLRDFYSRTTGKDWKSPQGEPSQEYVIWLEGKAMGN